MMNMETLLKGNTVSLRAPEPDDLDKLYLWENDTTLWPHGSTRAPFTRHQLWQYIDSYDGDIFSARQLRFIIVSNESGEAVGTADIYDFDPLDGHAKTGIFVDSSYRLRGIGSEALALLAEYAHRCTPLHQLAALIRKDNSPSIALFTRNGFRSAGCLRSWTRTGSRYCDVLIFQRLFD